MYYYYYCTRLCRCPEIFLELKSVQTLQESFRWDYKLRSPVCLCKQKDHIHSMLNYRSHTHTHTHTHTVTHTHCWSHNFNIILILLLLLFWLICFTCKYAISGARAGQECSCQNPEWCQTREEAADYQTCPGSWGTLKLLFLLLLLLFL